MTDRISKRAVFLSGGHDPTTAKEFFGRLGREIARFDKGWGVSTSISSTELVSGGEAARATIRTEAGDWRTETDFNFFLLDKIVMGDFSRPLPLRLWKYLVMFGDYVAT